MGRANARRDWASAQAWSEPMSKGGFRRLRVAMGLSACRPNRVFVPVLVGARATVNPCEMLGVC